MKKLNLLSGIVVASVAFAAVFLIQSSLAQVKQGKTRLLKTEQLMEGVIKPHCGALKEGLKSEPANAKAWKKLTMHAALLNEASFILMDDGRCPDKVWADAATKTLRQGSADLVRALEAKNLADAREAFGSMSGACKDCHDKHKEK